MTSADSAMARRRTPLAAGCGRGSGASPDRECPKPKPLRVRLLAVTTALALAAAHLPTPAPAQNGGPSKGPPTIRDAEIEQLLREYVQPILRVAGLAKQNVQVV